MFKKRKKVKTCLTRKKNIYIYIIYILDHTHPRENEKVLFTPLPPPFTSFLFPLPQVRNLEKRSPCAGSAFGPREAPRGTLECARYKSQTMSFLRSWPWQQKERWHGAPGKTSWIWPWAEPGSVTIGAMVPWVWEVLSSTSSGTPSCLMCQHTDML